MMVFGEYPQGYLPQLFIAYVVVIGRKLGDVGITQVELSNKLNVSRRTISTLLANI